ncbi:MAG TPA: M23 family peptidase [Desulfosporosinus sp.]|jgi:murein DD-endopeptidase MepM/ murein hydrolase activator NlpD|nr:M23 family peptidase [Desulfosporosinus sp.]
MKRWKGSKIWPLIGGFFLLVGGILLYTGYLSPLKNAAQAKTPVITTHETVQAVTANPASDPEADVTALKTQTQTAEITGGDQTNKDFPSPVQGSPLRWVGNYYSEAFDSYLFHAGTDYAEPEGTMIRTTHGGKVIFSGEDPILGEKVTLDCGQGWLVTYGGLVNLRVQVGQIVETQAALGQVGLFKAGKSESNQPQLHYEVWHGDEVQRVIP